MPRCQRENIGGEAHGPPGEVRGDHATQFVQTGLRVGADRNIAIQSILMNQFTLGPNTNHRLVGVLQGHPLTGCGIGRAAPEHQLRTLHRLRARALVEAGIPVDWIGGSSIGTIIGGSLAHGWSPQEVFDNCREAFVGHNPFNDYTFPVVSLLAGKKMMEQSERFLSTRQQSTVDYDEMPSAFTLLRSKWLRLGRRYRVPGLGTVLMKSIEIGTIGQVETLANMADLLITPNVRGYGMTDVRPFDRIVEVGYEEAVKALQESGFKVYDADAGYTGAALLSAG
jgi:hypothetical protein